MDFKKLLTRTCSGLIYCLIIVGAILLGTHGVIALATILAALACIEFSKMDRELNMKTIPLVLLDMAGCICLCLGVFVFPLFIWLTVILFRFIEEMYVEGDHHFSNLAHSLMSQIYIGVPMGLMVAIAYLLDPMIIMAIFLFIWINDTGAFLVGCTCGRHKLFERISPKKTWEGFIGGLLLTMGAGALFCYFGNSFFGMNVLNAGIGIWLGLAAIVSIFGTWGDLAESLMKRSMHLKDSGNMIPGHGGILDRIDSLLLALPSAFIYFILILTA